MLQKVGIWDDLGRFSFFTSVWGWGTVIFQRSGLPVGLAGGGLSGWGLGYPDLLQVYDALQVPTGRGQRLEIEWLPVQELHPLLFK